MNISQYVFKAHRVNGHSTAWLKPNWSRSPYWQMYALPQSMRGEDLEIRNISRTCCDKNSWSCPVNISDKIASVKIFSSRKWIAPNVFFKPTGSMATLRQVLCPIGPGHHTGKCMSCPSQCVVKIYKLEIYQECACNTKFTRIDFNSLESQLPR